MVHIKSFAKINLSLDVGAVMENGMHPVDMVMQQTTLCDNVMVDVRADKRDNVRADECGADVRDTAYANIALADDFSLLLKTNNAAAPTDKSNIVCRAAELMIEKYQESAPERFFTDEKRQICIYLEKFIPVSAGLAGGSGNAAAVLHALNIIWELGLTLSELCEIGKRIGSDVPFCIMGQSKENFVIPSEIRMDELAATCARARGTGTELTPCYPLRSHIVIAKPNLEVSTAEVYRGIDSCAIESRPNNDRLVEAITRHSIERAVPEMINVLENYTLAAYPEVAELKSLMKEKMTGALHVVMSGSGPSVFAIFDDELAAIEGYKAVCDCGYEAHLCKAK